MERRTENQILVKLADFGASLHLSDDSGEHLGTAACYAPECFGQNPKFGTEMDVWALGIIVMRLLDKLPNGPYFPEGASQLGPDSPYADGWKGEIKACMARYRRSKPDVSEHFLEILSRMFESDPSTRIRASEACKHLRGGYTTGYLLSLGMEDDDPTAIAHVLPFNNQGGDDSIFKFGEMNIQGLDRPLVVLEGGHLVNILQLLEAKSEAEDDMEVITHKALRELEGPCWRFKRTHNSPETYMRFDDALKLCKQTDHLKQFVRPLKEQKALLDKAAKKEEDDIKKAAKAKGKDVLKKAVESIKAPSSMRQLDLLMSISASDYVVAITEQDRMLLVRASDGSILNSSIYALRAGRLLRADALQDAEASSMPLEQARLLIDVITHEDIVSLGAATYYLY